MAEPARVMYVRLADHAAIEAFIQGSAVLNAGGGTGYFTVELNQTGLDTDPVEWMGLSWNLPGAWFGLVTSFVNSQGWSVNNGTAGCQFTDYLIGPGGGANRPDWEACLADTIRKPDALMVIVEPVP